MLKDNLKTLRKNNGLSQEELSSKLNVVIIKMKLNNTFLNKYI